MTKKSVDGGKDEEKDENSKGHNLESSTEQKIIDHSKKGKADRERQMSIISFQPHTLFENNMKKNQSTTQG